MFHALNIFRQILFFITIELIVVKSDILCQLHFSLLLKTKFWKRLFQTKNLEFYELNFSVRVF